VYGRQPRALSGLDFELDAEMNDEEVLLDRIKIIVELNLSIIPKAKRNIAKYKKK
jgi:hypothetical protein